MAASGDEDATARRAKIAEAIVAHRRGDEPAVCFQATTGETPVVEYTDREIVLRVTEAMRDRLDTLLSAFPVFKIAQPATRKAPDGEIHIAALADPKHTADFVDRLFLDVFEVESGYEITSGD